MCAHGIANLIEATQSGRATRHDAYRRKRVDRIAMLVESCPFDPSNPLALCLRRREFDHLPFEVKPIARTDGGEPPQFVDAKPEQWMRSKWMQVNGQPHGNRCCMPPRSSEALQWRLLGGGFVKMIGLGIELRCEPLDIFARDNFFLAFKTHANSKIVEPFDHRRSPSWIAALL